MGKILLLAILITGYYLPSFSQSTGQLKTDTASVKFGMPLPAISLGNFDTTDFRKLLKSPDPNKYSTDFKLAAKDVQFGQLSNSRIRAPHSYDNMPCLYPQGTFPMPVYKPDSATRYTLLIKK